MFVRLKKIKGQHYAYHVENRRSSGKVRQKVKGYVGKAIIPEKKKDLSFELFINKPTGEFIKQNTYPEIVSALIRWELEKHDLSRLNVDPINHMIHAGNNEPVVVKINEGHLYHETIKGVKGFTASSDDEYLVGQELAKVFVRAGIAIPPDVFVPLFEKVMQKE